MDKGTATTHGSGILVCLTVVSCKQDCKHNQLSLPLKLRQARSSDKKNQAYQLHIGDQIKYASISSLTEYHTLVNHSQDSNYHYIY